MPKPVRFIVIGAGDRGITYSNFGKLYPEDFRITAVADENIKRLNSFSEKFNIPLSCCYTDYRKALSTEKNSDAVIIATPDNEHFKPAVLAMKKGYDIILEKPISNKLKECIEVGKQNKKYKRIITVCHVLRYTPFYRKLKKIIQSGLLGDIVTIEHIEPVGYWHMVHSYVRGNWNNSKTSSPMILSKSCHDLDIILWLMNKKPLKVS